MQECVCPTFCIPNGDCERAGLERLRLASAIEQAAEAVVMTDAAGAIQYVNPAFTGMTGYSSEEAMGQNPSILKSGRQDPQYYTDLWETIRDGRVWRGELINRRKDGSLYTEEMTITPVRDPYGATTSYIAIKQDVTRRRAAEEAQRFLASIVECTEDAVISLALDGTIMTWNGAADALYGYRAEEVVGKPMTMLVAPEKAARFLGYLAGLERGERYPQYESAGVRKDGTKLEVSVSLSPIRNGAGEVVAGATIVRNITEQKRADRALRDGEERFRAAFEHAPFGVCLTTPEHRIVQVNQTFCRMVGYSAEDLAARGWREITHPDDVDASQRAIELLQRDRLPVVELEKRYLHRDGHPVWARVRISQVRESNGPYHFITHVEDITESRRAEAVVRQSEAKYRRLVDNLPDVSWICNCFGDTCYVSPNVENVCGYSPQEICAEGTAWWRSRIHPEDRARMEEAFEALFSQNRPLDVEFRMRRKDDTWIWVNTRAMGTYEQEGMLYADGVFSDITARQAAERALRESEEKYRALITNIPNVVWTADAGGQMAFLSPNCERMYGYTPEELCQPGSWFDRVHPGDRERAREAYRTFFAGRGEYNVEYRFQTKDRRLIWVHDRAVSSYEKDGKLYADGCVTDVTERKSRAALIERLQQRTELILSSAGEGILGLDPNGNFTFANPAAARMLGFAPQELVGRPLHGLIRHARADGTECSPSNCGVLRSIRKGVEYRATDEAFRPRQGASFPVEFISTPKIENGRLTGAVVVFRDVTEARTAQERIAASLKEKEALLREIHHRVKNNLQVVCSMLKLNSRNLRDAEARHIFEDTQNRVKAMALVHETLYRSGNLAGIDFSEYVPRLADQLLRAYGLSTRQVKTTTELESAVLPVDVAIPCALILTELISNAAKHAFAVERSGQLRIAFRRRAGPGWLLEVENSAGVQAPECAPAQGSSFGLELVRLLTEQLDGTTRIDRGASFRVSLEFPAAGETPGETT